MNVGRKAALGIGALVGLLTLGTTAHAAFTSFTVDKCLSGKLKTITKGASAYAACHAKDSAKPDAVKFNECLAKNSAKITTAFGKLDVKYTSCTGGTGNGAALDSDAGDYADDLNTDVGDAVGKCDAAKQKCVGKYIAGIGGCFAKAAGKVPGAVDSICTGKVAGKLFDGIKGCLDKAAAAGDCSNPGNQGAALKSAADAYIASAACELDPTNSAPECVPPPTPTPTSTPGGPSCGNGTVDVGEDCDTVGAGNTCQNASNTSAAFTCNPVTCQCACPTQVTFTGNATSPFSVLDTGWTGISHRAPIISNGTTTVTLSGCSGSSRPCGVCNVTGPVENPNAGAGQLRTRRCVADTSVGCPNGDVDCGGGPGSCQYFFGAPLSLAAGGVTTCVVNQFNGSVTGTANVETGYAVTNANLTARVYNGIGIDNPCPRCSDAGAFNDGLAAGGTCDGGPRAGLPCDANGDIPARPDFGRTSLDCPPNPAGIIATLPIDLSNKTDVVTKTLTTSSPNCTNSPGNKCLCDTCNNAAATPCFTNADCVAVGATQCGGRRCLGGANNGAPCSNVSECPGMMTACARPGEATRPAACLDDTVENGNPNSVFECDDGDADGEGECTNGPTDQNCSLASGHAQRGCLNDGDCGGGMDTCQVFARGCFLTGGGTFQPGGTLDGTDTLSATGMSDTPMNDTSNPTLAAVFCVGPTGSSSINNVAGLPGPSRVTINGNAVGRP